MMGPGYGPGYGPGMGEGRPGERLRAPGAANLSEEQQEQLRQLRQKEWEATKDLRQQLFTKHEALRGLRLQAEPDEAALDTLEKEVFDLHQQLRAKRFEYRQEADKIAPDLGRQGKSGKRFSGRQGRGYAAGAPCWR
jgi:Spy/CpxP family protein refolding chaperone